ncbi:QWRF motif-containing protein 8 [Dorcoceras hygrometricum]|uniref:QWRF motif-containing protein 8 n=1 Tax=Dorcoceras hygrometricum TaxID=472368 RepID=A0A2Z7BPV0_9LAMI|nr:QWRF motif-containing protein 8 [Dorcoceras hygrometricum]
MDVCEAEALQTQSTAETSRPPLVPADNKNETTHRSRTREVSSRYRSPTLSTANGPKRCPSPNASRTSPTSTVLAPKRAISAERKRLSRPSSPPSPIPSTPLQDTSGEMLLASKKVVGNNRLSESLWPSTMRSLSVSFQSDIISVPTSKKEKPVSHTFADRTLRPSSNITRRQAETPASRKATPERKRSPVKGKNSDQSENSKPFDILHTRLVDQHRWPSRIGGKISSGTLNRSIDLTDRINRTSSLPHSGTGVPSLRRLSLDGASKPLQKSSSDLLMLLSRDDSGNRCSIDDNSLRRQKSGSSSSSDRTLLMNSVTKTQSITNPGSRPPSPSRSLSRGVSPSRSKTTNPSRAPSPTQSRPSSPSRQPQSSASVLSFIVDVKKGKKAANHIEDVHQLRLLYNRHLQWRYATAQTDAALHSQKVKAEDMLYSVWRTTVDMLDSVVAKRIELQQLSLHLKICSVLNDNLAGLNEWASVERDHTISLTSAIQDLQSSTIRIPITGRAKGDIETVKVAVCSAVDVMQALGSSLCSILPQVEGMNHLVSKLADISAQERALLDEYESLMGCSAAFQCNKWEVQVPSENHSEVDLSSLLAA